MGTLLFGLRKLYITARLDDINAQLMMLSNRKQLMTSQTQSLTEQKSKRITRQLNQLDMENVTSAQIQAISLSTNDIDSKLSMLSMRESDMTAIMNSLQTEQKSLSTEYDEIVKGEDKAIKKTFGLFASSTTT